MYPYILYRIGFMTFIDISNRLAVKHTKTWPLDGATFQKYYRPILSSYPNLRGVCIMIFLYICNGLAVKHKKPFAASGAT